MKRLRSKIFAISACLIASLWGQRAQADPFDACVGGVWSVETYSSPQTKSYVVVNLLGARCTAKPAGLLFVDLDTTSSAVLVSQITAAQASKQKLYVVFQTATESEWGSGPNVTQGNRIVRTDLPASSVGSPVLPGTLFIPPKHLEGRPEP